MPHGVYSHFWFCIFVTPQKSQSKRGTNIACFTVYWINNKHLTSHMLTSH